jgi:hypothetical protein
MLQLIKCIYVMCVIRRGIKKRVVEISIKDVEGTNTPPSDSWAWRKYRKI